ncbi:unnamed protein product, partial [Owenia fusiformis]
MKIDTVSSTSITGCGHPVYLNGSSGDFVSPGYKPNSNSSYPHSTACEWEIQVNEGLGIELKFRVFELEDGDECENDYVRLKCTHPMYLDGSQGHLYTPGYLEDINCNRYPPDENCTWDIYVGNGLVSFVAPGTFHEYLGCSLKKTGHGPGARSGCRHGLSTSRLNL